MLQSTKSNLIINNAVELGDNISLEDKGKGRHFTSRFIEAGLAHYQEFGDVLITKETLDKFVYSMVGCPVIIRHKDITAKNVDKERVGVVSKVWYNELDGWFWCEGIIWDKQAIDLIKNQGWSVSCTYDFESDFKKGTYHGKEYDMEFTGGEFLHLALVDNPRYERANIVVNSKDKVTNWTKDTFKEEEVSREEGKFARKGSGFNKKLQDIKESLEKQREEEKRQYFRQDTTGMAFYDSLLQDKDFAQRKGYTVKTKMMSPLDYIQKVREGFNEQIRKSESRDEISLEELMEGRRDKALEKLKEKFGETELDMPILEYSNANELLNQEGLHRAIIAFDKGVSEMPVGIFVKNERGATNSKDSNIENAKDKDGNEGEWITVKGNHIFVKKGQSKEKAIEEFIDKQIDERNKNKESKIDDLKEKHKVGEKFTISDMYGTEEHTIKEITKSNYGDIVVVDEKGYQHQLDKVNFEKQQDKQDLKDKESKKEYSLSKEYKNHIQFKEDKESSGYPRKIYKDLDSAKKLYESKREGQRKAEEINLKRSGKRGIPLRDKPIIVKNPLGDGYIVATVGLMEKYNLKEVYPIKRTENEGDITMSVLNELKEFIQNVVNNKGENMVVENEKVDKRDIIRQIMAIAGKEEASEDVKTIAKLAEKLAYDSSEDSKADNKAKNEEDEEKEEKFEEEKEIANKKAKNEEDEEKEAENKCKNEEEEEKVEEVKEKAENKCKNSMDETREIVYGGSKVENMSYIPISKRIELGNNY